MLQGITLCAEEGLQTLKHTHAINIHVIQTFDDFQCGYHVVNYYGINLYHVTSSPARS